MRLYVYGYILLVCIGLFSCTRDLKLPEIKSPKKIVLLGELVAGEPIYIRAGGSVPLSGATPVLELVKDLNLTLQDRSGAAIGLTGAEDSLSQGLSTIPFTSAEVVAPSTTYTVTATHPTLAKVTATVPMPAPFTATIVKLDSSDMGPDFMTFLVTINDPSTEDFYAIEAVKQKMNVTGYFYFKSQWLGLAANQTVYDSLLREGIEAQKKYDTVFYKDYRRYTVLTYDANTENLKNNSSYSGFRRILLGDYAFRSQEYTTRVSVSKNINVSDDSFQGRMVIMVKSVSKDYFLYLSTYESHEELVGLNNTSSIGNFKSNVQNGLGIVGGVYKKEFYFPADQ